MKSLFKRNANPVAYNSNYLLMQEKWTGKMNSLTQNLSKKKLICLLILFIVLTSSFFIWNIYRSFSSGEIQKKPAEQISKIKSIQLKKNER